MSDHKFSRMFVLTLAPLVAFALMATSGARAQANVIYSFGASAGDGATPYTTFLVADPAGNLYGTTEEILSGVVGTVFELSLGVTGAWSEQIIHTFASDGSEGSSVQSSLVRDSAGNLYGVAGFGGSDNYGTVFELSPSGGSWILSVIHNFTGGGIDGTDPTGGLILDASWNLYGVTLNGGAHGYGAVFEMHHAGGAWTERVLFSFNDADGWNPNGQLLMDSAGNLYGTTYNGGLHSEGVAFELLRSGGWAEKVLHNFANLPADGKNPNGSLVMLSGNLYGTTISGGTFDGGTVFQLVPHAGGGWVESLIHSFTTTGSDGENPRAGLTVVGSSLYGTTASGGSSFDGTVFGLTQSGGTWTENFLINMTDADGGAGYPSGGLLLYTDGNLYGTAQGGVNGVGSVYEASL